VGFTSREKQGLNPALDLSNFAWGSLPLPPLYPPLPLPPLPPSLPLSLSLPYPSPLPSSPPTLPFPPSPSSPPVPSPPLEVGPLFAAKGCGGALKLPHRVRAEPGRQTFSGAF